MKSRPAFVFGCKGSRYPVMILLRVECTLVGVFRQNDDREWTLSSALLETRRLVMLVV